MKDRFNYSINDPSVPETINKGKVTHEEFKIIFRAFPWEELLIKQNSLSEKEIYFSPSLNLENEKGIGVSVSIVGEIDEYEFYVCYNRPVLLKKRKWFKVVLVNEFFCSVIPEQTLEGAFEAFECLWRNELIQLEDRWG